MSSSGEEGNFSFQCSKPLESVNSPHLHKQPYWKHDKHERGIIGKRKGFMEKTREENRASYDQKIVYITWDCSKLNNSIKMKF